MGLGILKTILTSSGQVKFSKGHLSWMKQAECIPGQLWMLTNPLRVQCSIIMHIQDTLALWSEDSEEGLLVGVGSM